MLGVNAPVLGHPLTTGPSAFAAGGLVLDIGGALLLALALVFKTPDRAAGESEPRMDFNVDLDVGLAEQTADAQAGASLLTLGFALQLVVLPTDVVNAADRGPVSE